MYYSALLTRLSNAASGQRGASGAKSHLDDTQPERACTGLFSPEQRYVAVRWLWEQASTTKEVA